MIVTVSSKGQIGGVYLKERGIKRFIEAFEKHLAETVIIV